MVYIIAYINFNINTKVTEVLTLNTGAGCTKGG